MFAVPLAIEGVVDLGVFVCFLFLIALAFAYSQTLGLVLANVAKALDSVASNVGFLGFLFSSPAGWITDVDNSIRAAIGTGIAATEYAWHKMLHYTAVTLTAVGEGMAYVAGEFYGVTLVLVKHWIPYQIAAAIYHALVPVKQSVARTATATRTLPARVATAAKAAAAAPSLTLPRVPSLSKAAGNIKAVAAAAAGTLVFPRIGQLERDAASVRRNIAKLRRFVNVGTLAGLGAFALSQLGLGGSNCSNAKKWSNGLCGLSSKVLDDLLLGLVSVFGTLSLVKLAEDYQGLIADVSGEVQHFWRADVVGAGADRQLGQTGL